MNANDYFKRFQKECRNHQALNNVLLDLVNEAKKEPKSTLPKETWKAFFKLASPVYLDGKMDYKAFDRMLNHR